MHNLPFVRLDDILAGEAVMQVSQPLAFAILDCCKYQDQPSCSGSVVYKNNALVCVPYPSTFSQVSLDLDWNQHVGAICKSVSLLIWEHETDDCGRRRKKMQIDANLTRFELSLSAQGKAVFVCLSKILVLRFLSVHRPHKALKFSFHWNHETSATGVTIPALHSVLQQTMIRLQASISASSRITTNFDSLI